MYCQRCCQKKQFLFYSFELLFIVSRQNFPEELSGLKTGLNIFELQEHSGWKWNMSNEIYTLQELAPSAEKVKPRRTFRADSFKKAPQRHEWNTLKLRPSFYTYNRLCVFLQCSYFEFVASCAVGCVVIFTVWLSIIPERKGMQTACLIKPTGKRWVSYQQGNICILWWQNV